MTGSGLFNEIKEGSESAIDHLLASKKESLYDYLYRMTGDRHLSYRGLYEVTEAVFGELTRYGSYDELRFTLYSTSRRFNRESWNASTDLLISQKPLPLEEADIFLEEELSIDQDLLAFETAFSKLNGGEREVLLLLYKVGFTQKEVAKIMGVAESYLKAQLKAAEEKMTPHLPNGETLSETVHRLPCHPLPEIHMSHTMALSQVIENVRNSNRSRRPLYWILGGLILLVFGYLAYTYGPSLLP